MKSLHQLCMIFVGIRNGGLGFAAIQVAVLVGVQGGGLGFGADADVGSE